MPTFQKLSGHSATKKKTFRPGPRLVLIALLPFNSTSTIKNYSTMVGESCDVFSI